MATRDHNDNPQAAINHTLFAERTAFADAYYSRLKDCPDYTRKRVTLAMLRDILEHMVFPVVGLSLDSTDAAFAANEQMMQIVRQHAAMKARLNDSLEDDG